MSLFPSRANGIFRSAKLVWGAYPISPSSKGRPRCRAKPTWQRGHRVRQTHRLSLHAANWQPIPRSSVNNPLGAGDGFHFITVLRGGDKFVRKAAANNRKHNLNFNFIIKIQWVAYTKMVIIITCRLERTTQSWFFGLIVAFYCLSSFCYFWKWNMTTTSVCGNFGRHWLLI